MELTPFCIPIDLECMLNVFERDNNEHIHLVNVSLNVNLNEDYQVLKYQSLDQTTKNLIFIRN